MGWEISVEGAAGVRCGPEVCISGATSLHELQVITMQWMLFPFGLCTSNPQIMTKNVKSFKLKVFTH